MPFSSSYLVPAAVSLALSLALTPLVRTLARRRGFVAKPKADRWHRKPTAMLGGVAIFLSVAAAYLLLVPHTREGWVVMCASAALFAVGLVDDFLHIKPYQKLIGQVLGATAVVYFGLLLPWGWGASVAMAEMPAASPSMLSSRLMAFVMPMSQKIVTTSPTDAPQPQGKSSPK